MSNYFRVGNLTALRELALLWLAGKVDDQLDRYHADHAPAWARTGADTAEVGSSHLVVFSRPTVVTDLIKSAGSQNFTGAISLAMA